MATDTGRRQTSTSSGSGPGSAWRRGAARLAIFVVAGCGGVTAQQMLERASAVGNRHVPAKVPFDPALVSALVVPAGFTVNLFASGLGQPRMMEIGPDGSLYVTRRGSDDVMRLRDADGNGSADSSEVFASNLSGVHGIARSGDQLYLASSTTVWRTPIAAAAPQVIVQGLPDGGQHANRTVRAAPDGALFVSVGSSCNDCAEENQLERGTLMRYAADGSSRTIFAKGLRNTIGYDWHPGTAALWGFDHGNDFHGDEIPPEELNELKDGSNYGWPICYGERTVDPMTNAPPERLALRPGEPKADGLAISRGDYCARTEPSTLTLPAHSAPMAARFYRLPDGVTSAAAAFPQAWRNDLIVALRGSWNRAQPVGYKVVRVRFGADGRPLGGAAGVEDVLSGFLAADGNSFMGRPTGVVIAADGALLVSDDANGAIWRVAWRGP